MKTTATKHQHEIRVVEPAERDAKFWVQMGPRFVDQTLLKEMPYFTDRGYTWFLAEQAGHLIGCAAVEIKNDTAVLHHLWVSPEHRGNGVGPKLAQARLDWAKKQGAKLAKAVVTEKWVAGLKKLGFKAGSARGKYVTMEKVL